MSKIAFCFLLYSKVDNPKQWSKFFNNADKNKYTIYSHLKEKTTDTQDFLIDGSIKSIPTAWGEYSLFKASLLLFKEALKDTQNKHMILLSGSCIPIYTFDEIYKDLIHTTKSRIHSRYINESNVYANSQWLSLYRSDALSIVRLLNKKDIVAQKFLKFWLPETRMDGDGFLSGYLGPDEIFPINWFIYVYGNSSKKVFDLDAPRSEVIMSIYTSKFQKHIDMSSITYAYFKKGLSSPEILSNMKISKKKKEIICSHGLFARKFINDKNSVGLCPKKSKKRTESLVFNEKGWKYVYGGMLF